MEYINERTVALTKPPKADKQPSEHLKKCAKEIINHLLGLANKLNKEDRAVYKYIEKLNGSMNLVYDSSYNENGIPIEVSGVIDPDKKADEIAEAALKSNGFTKLTMAKGNSNVYYKSFGETSKVIAIVNGQKGGLLRSYSLINLYTSSSLTECTIFEGVQFLGESIVLNEFHIKDTFDKFKRHKDAKSTKKEIKEPEKDSDYAHCVVYSDEFEEAVVNATIDLMKKHITKLSAFLNKEKFDGNKDAIILLPISPANAELSIYPVWVDGKNYYVNDVIEYILYKAVPMDFDKECTKRYDDTPKIREANEYLNRIEDKAKEYFSSKVGIDITTFTEGDWHGVDCSMRFPISKIVEMYDIKEK